MSGLLQHLKVSAIADGPDASQVQPSDWNAAHVFAGGNHGAIPVRDTTDATYGSSWLASVAAGQVLVSNGVGALPSWTASLVLGGSLTVNGFGFHSFGGGGTGPNILSLRNPAAGASNFARFEVGNDASVNTGILDAFSSIFTSGGANIADSAKLEGSGTQGLVLAASAPSGLIRIFVGGTAAEKGRMHSSGGFSWGDVVDPGLANLRVAGTLEVVGGVYKGGTAYTHPRWAFEQAYTGQIVQSLADAAEDGITDYGGRLTLEATEACTRDHWELPLMRHNPHGDLFSRGDLLLASLEEAYLHLFDLHRRLVALETA